MRAVPVWVDKVHDKDKIEQWYVSSLYEKFSHHYKVEIFYITKIRERAVIFKVNGQDLAKLLLYFTVSTVYASTQMALS